MTLLSSEVLEPVLFLFVLQVLEHFVKWSFLTSLIIEYVTSLDRVEHTHTPYCLPEYAF